MKLSQDSIQRCRNRERCAKPLCEKGDKRRYPQHTLAPNEDEPELDLQPPLYGENPYKGDSHG